MAFQYCSSVGVRGSTSSDANVNTETTEAMTSGPRRPSNTAPSNTGSTIKS
jgi:hypothetical protein